MLHYKVFIIKNRMTVFKINFRNMIMNIGKEKHFYGQLELIISG